MRQFLFDTNAVSALRHAHKQPAVAAYLDSLDPEMVVISVMTLGEVRKGLVSKRRRSPDGVLSLSRWIDELERTYANRIIEIDVEIAKVWGDISSDRTRPVVDTLLAATAIVHNLTLVTRNTSDFEGLPVKLFNPWLA